MFGRLREDIATVFKMDPAARTRLEIAFCYPGLHAVWIYRVSNYLWRHKIYFLARLLSHIGRFLTGIEIHPGATIGRRFFIDHGSGVVIGETAEIADDVLMYQGVVLGGTSLDKGKRHPTVGSNVVMGGGSAVLGPVVLGDGAKVGAGSVVVKTVPPFATVVGVPGKVVQEKPHPMAVLDHADLPDPVAEAITLVLRSHERLQDRVGQLEEKLGVVQKATATNHRPEREEALLAEFTRGAGI